MKFTFPKLRLNDYFSTSYLVIIFTITYFSALLIGVTVYYHNKSHVREKELRDSLTKCQSVKDSTLNHFKPHSR